LLGIASGISGPSKDTTAAEKAAAVKGEADLIYQQQRLVVCQADPTKCTN
jgi:hypothetical protein